VQHGNESSTLIQERQERAPKELYGGRILERNGDVITRKLYVPTCDSCGLRIGDNDRVKVCTSASCKAKICQTCSVIYQGETYCIQCLRSRLAIDEFDYDVLSVIITFGKMDIPGISREIGVTTQAVRTSLPNLLRANLIRRRAVSVFAQFEATPLARHNLLAIGKLFGVTLPTREENEP
jgi:hypothetical protein